MIIKDLIFPILSDLTLSCGGKFLTLEKKFVTFTQIKDRKFAGVCQSRTGPGCDNAIHRINHYPVDSVVCFVNIYPLDSLIYPLDSVIQPSNNWGQV